MTGKMIGQKEGKKSGWRKIFAKGKVIRVKYLGGTLLDAWTVIIQVSDASEDLKVDTDQEVKFWYFELNKNEISSGDFDAIQETDHPVVLYLDFDNVGISGEIEPNSLKVIGFEIQ